MEFFGPFYKGKLLSGSQRRLATRSSLVEVQDESELAIAKQIVADCNSYFKANPYKRWFDPLDQLMRTALNKSYYDGSACHIDLFPWATDQVWSRLEKRQQVMLIDAGKDYLKALIQKKQFDLLLLNGRTVIDTVQKHFGNPLTQVERVESQHLTQSIEIYSGRLYSTQCLAWSVNVQNYRGKRVDLFHELKDILIRHRITKSNAQSVSA